MSLESCRSVPSEPSSPSILRSRIRPNCAEEHRVQASHAEHTLLVSAMTRGDSAEAAVIMREHMLNASDALMRYLTRADTSGVD